METADLPAPGRDGEGDLRANGDAGWELHGDMVDSHRF